MRKVKTYKTLTLERLMRGEMSRIYDVFPFFNEINLLKIRFETLWDTVDYFVVCEAGYTFSGETKISFFTEFAADFEKYAAKIIHLQCDANEPEHSPFEREWFQRNYFKAQLNGLLGPTTSSSTAMWMRFLDRRQ